MAGVGIEFIKQLPAAQQVAVIQQMMEEGMSKAEVEALFARLSPQQQEEFRAKWAGAPLGGALRFNSVGFQFGLAEAASGGKTGAGVVWKNDLSSGANHNVTFGYIRMTTGPTTSDMEFVSGDRTAGVGGDNQYWRDMLFRNEAYIGAAGYTRTWLTQEASNRRLLFYGATNDATYSFTNPGDNRVAMWVKQDNAAGTSAVLRIEQNLSRESYYIVFDGAYLDFSDGGTHKGRAIKVGVTTGGSWAGSGWLYVFDSATPPFAWA